MEIDRSGHGSRAAQARESSAAEVSGDLTGGQISVTKIKAAEGVELFEVSKQASAAPKSPTEINGKNSEADLGSPFRVPSETESHIQAGAFNIDR